MDLMSAFDASLSGRAARRAVEYVDAGGAERTLTFGEVAARAAQTAHELRARGLAKGDRLCVHLANRIEFIDLYLACVQLGAIFVPINVLYRERELAHIVADAEPKAIVTPAASDAAYPAGLARWTAEDIAGRAASQSTTRVAPHTDGAAPAAIIYTSGTTGVAKGAALSHGNLIANGAALTAAWRIDESDRYLAVLPLFHVHGLANGVHSWLLSGCFMHLAERFDHRTAAATFERFAPTLFFGVPTIYVRLLDPSVVSDAAAHAIGARARLFVSGSAPLPAHVHKAFHHRFGHTILERYGMSEALMIASNPYDGPRRAGTVGPPLAHASVRLMDEHDVPVNDGDVGEVQVRSSALFSGYWRREDATADAFVDGWFRTGDLGVRSPDGYLTLRGRRGDLIISGGFNIYPREIEELLLEDARVREVAVVGADDPVRGEVPVAYVVTDTAFDLDELSARCRTELASFKAPRAFIRVDALPRTALGKIQRHLLPPWKPA